jgi:hypothetical protein
MSIVPNLLLGHEADGCVPEVAHMKVSLLFCDVAKPLLRKVDVHSLTCNGDTGCADGSQVSDSTVWRAV